VAKLLSGRAGRPPSFSKFTVPVHDRQSICLKRLGARVLLVESLTLGDQDVERLLNCLDGQPRLSHAMPSFPLTHAEPPAPTRPALGRTLGVLARASAIPEYGIGPQKGEPLQGILRPRPTCREMREVRQPGDAPLLARAESASCAHHHAGSQDHLAMLGDVTRRTAPPSMDSQPSQSPASWNPRSGYLSLPSFGQLRKVRRPRE
jgi:hypothetical protein